MAIDHFRNCGAGADYLRRMIELDDGLSPSEMSSLWQDRRNLPDFVVQHVARTIDMMAGGSPYIRPYERTAISPNVDLFGARSEGRRKSLLICFCGDANRPMLPLSTFLQFIPEDRFDILMILDPSRYGYLKGVPDFGEDLVEVVEAIRAVVKLDGYADVRCMGVSSGGAAALYAGLLLDAERAVSICGKHRSLSRSVIGQSGQEPALTGDEFDAMVKDRIEASATKLLVVFGADAARDVEGALSLRKRLPACRRVGIHGLAGHNALKYLLDRNGLGDFFERFLFDDEIRIPRNAEAPRAAPMRPDRRSPDRRWRELALRALVANPMIFLSMEHQAALSAPDSDVDFVDLGMDSLGRMELSIWLELELGLDAADAQAQEFDSLNGLAIFLADRLPRRSAG